MDKKLFQQYKSRLLQEIDTERYKHFRSLDEWSNILFIKFDSWYYQIEQECFDDFHLLIWLYNQIDYYGEKDREYAKFLNELCEKGME